MKKIASALFALLALQCQATSIDEINKTKILLQEAKKLVYIKQFNGAVLCSFISHKLSNISSGEDYSANAFLIGKKNKYNMQEVMVAMAISIASINARLNAYTDGMVDGIKGIPNSIPESTKENMKLKLLKHWDKENNCNQSRKSTEY